MGMGGGGSSVSTEGRDFHDNSCQRVDEIGELTYPVLQIHCISLILPSFATIIIHYGAYISFRPTDVPFCQQHVPAPGRNSPRSWERTG